MSEHSAKFERVKRYYDAGLWTKQMVLNAVGKWITAAEYAEITAEQQKAAPKGGGN